MNKKVSLLGKEFSVFVLVAVMMVGLASAALVSYISNSVSGTATVESPLTFEVSTTGYSSMSKVADFGTVYGGQTQTLYTKITNNANTPLTGNNVTIIVSDSVNNDVKCDEITEIVADDSSGNEVARLTDGTNALKCVDNGNTISIVTAPVILGAGASQSMSFDITVAPNMMPSTGYSYEGKVMYG